MKSTRPLTEQEIDKIKAAYLPKGPFLSLRDIQAFFVFLAGGLVLSTPFVLLFLGAARFLHHEEWSKALHISLLGFLPGLVLGPLFFVFGLIGANKSQIPGLKRDLKNGMCKVRRYKAIRAWRLVDDGNDEAPDLLVDLGADKLMAILAEDLPEAGEPAEFVDIAKLPISSLTVAVSFAGKNIPISKTPIVTDCIWRHDDLPWGVPFKLVNAPAELRTAIDAAGE